MWATGKFILDILECLLLSAHACFLWGGTSGTNCIIINLKEESISTVHYKVNYDKFEFDLEER
jgi:hypothetical protein